MENRKRFSIEEWCGGGGGGVGYPNAGGGGCSSGAASFWEHAPKFKHARVRIEPGETVREFSNDQRTWYRLNPDGTLSKHIDMEKEMKTVPVKKEVPAYDAVRIDRVNNGYVVHIEPHMMERCASIGKMFVFETSAALNRWLTKHLPQPKP